MTSNKLFVPRRVGVCGSSNGLHPAAVPFCVAIGRELARQENVVIVSGGTRQQLKRTDDLADWHIVNAAEQRFESISPMRLTAELRPWWQGPRSEHLPIRIKMSGFKLERSGERGARHAKPAAFLL